MIKDSELAGIVDEFESDQSSDAATSREAIFNAIKQKEKYVLDAVLKGAFDNINHQKLLHKLKTYPAMKYTIQAWLKAGAIDQGAFEETRSGTPQGGTVTPPTMWQTLGMMI